MRVLHIRFTIGSMMVGVAILAILSWLVIGLGQYGRRFFGLPPLYLVVAFPFLLTLATTFVVTFFQGYRGAGTKEQRGPVEQSQFADRESRNQDTWVRESKLKLSVLTILVLAGLLSMTAAAMGFFLPAVRTRHVRPPSMTQIGDQAEPSLEGAEGNTPESTPSPAAEAANGEIPVQRASLRSADTAALPFPPLPTRFSPGPISEPVQKAPVESRDALPMPPVPSKAPPGPGLEAAALPPPAGAL